MSPRENPNGEPTRVIEPSLIDACSLLSLVYFLLHCPKFWYAAGPVSALAIPALLFPGFRGKPWPWLGIAASVGLGVALNWFAADNHKYLSIYWALALACVHWSSAAKQPWVLATNARWLVAGCMLFATFWKLLSPTYLSGEFFEFTLLTDARFEAFLNTSTALDAEAIENNHTIYKKVRNGIAPPGQPSPLDIAPRVPLIAKLCTYWTIFIEGLIATVFLLPVSPSKAWVRHGPLIGFGATTYFMAPVPGFGCLLMLMGMSQANDTGSKLFRTYFCLFVLIQAAPIGVLSVWRFLAP